ncbi:MAG: prepilin-type N-terminal cleavage/methylation domain-containing protein [Wenzhouxiangella sp.]
MRRSAAGFTLIELLIVMVIGAVLAGVAALSVGAWRSDAVPERQIERFWALLEAQCDAALMQSRPRGVRLSTTGYDFWQATSGGWVALRPEGLNRPREWPQGLQPALIVEGRREALLEDPSQPQIICQPLGELTAFELEFGAGPERRRLSASAGGRFSVSREG